MKPFKLFSLLFSLLFTSAILLSSQAHAKLVVHEWGTFTSLVGSDGKAQDGMYHEDEVLPDFVHNFGDKSSLLSPSLFAWAPRDPIEPSPQPRPPSCRNIKVPCSFLFGQTITQKMETPVVYFYSDKAQTVKFNVWFPGGIISQTYPAPLRSWPEEVPGVELKNGFAHYKVNILKDLSVTPPAVEASNIYSHARNVASDLIQSAGETEKFIFYRGLGEFKTKLQTTSRAGDLKIKNSGLDTIPQVFLIYTDGKKHGSLLALGKIEAEDAVNVSAREVQNLKKSPQAQSKFLSEARTQLLVALTNAGLFADEAKAMVDTWEHGYFQTPGLRVLYVLGNHEVGSILPIQVTPLPDELSRVFVGRVEVLLDTEEEQILSQIQKQGRNFDVTSLGRMAQPILFRVKELALSRGQLTTELSSNLEYLATQIP